MYRKDYKEEKGGPAMATQSDSAAAEWTSNRPKPVALKINDDDDRQVIDILFSPAMEMEGPHHANGPTLRGPAFWVAGSGPS